MHSRRASSVGVWVGFLLVVSLAAPPPAGAVWVNSTKTQFQVGRELSQIIPAHAGTPFIDPTCDAQGGTSLALVQGRKLAGVDAVLNPLVLVVSCLSSTAANAARLTFISVTDGKVVKQISTTVVPGNGWAHLVLRPDKGDLLGCGNNGALHSIDFSQDTTSIADGTAAPLPFPSQVTSCKGLAWDAEADMIYVGVSAGPGIGRVVRFKDGATTLLGDFANLPCVAKGLAISGGVLLVSCEGALTILRLDKNTGRSLGVNGTLTATPLTAISPEPGLSDLACDPVTFHKDATGKDLFRDALWSRRGANGNAVVALEFPAFTCGLPSNSVVVQNGVPFSPLAAGLSAPAPGLPGAAPLAACFDNNGNVRDLDGDGLPDCWEASEEGSGIGIDFDGDGAVDLGLCAQVNTNGDGVTLTTECADPDHKDLFVEIDYMQFHKPDPRALSQTQSVDTPKSGGGTVGVQSVREAFAAAPVENPDTTTGIRIHLQVDEQVTFSPLSGGAPTSHVNQVAFTPCTGPASAAASPAQVVDFDIVKAGNFGTATERLEGPTTLNAKRLAFRYVLFAHTLVPLASGGAGGSGCAELGGDDAVVTLGSFAGTVAGHTGGFGSRDQQAGTFMHELGHLLGLEHGGHDKVNCKPNYRSVMSYNRQFAGSPLPNRRLDYSRSLDPLILLPNMTIDMNKTGILNEASLNELDGLGSDPSLGPLPPFFPLADQIVFGPNAWSLVSAAALDIDWNRNKAFQINATANINKGPTSGCDGSGTDLEGHDDWNNLLYRSSAAIDFASGRSSEPPAEMTSDDERAFYLASDADGNGVGDGTDCGGTIPDPPDGTTSFSCTHRLDTKPSPKGIKQRGNLEIVIFSEVNPSTLQVWDAPAQVITNDPVNFPLTFSVESVVIPVKVNKKGGGTCSAADRPDPVTGQKDGFRDLNCQVPLKGSELPTGTQFGIVSGFFFDPLTGENRAFSARQEVTILP